MLLRPLARQLVSLSPRQSAPLPARLPTFLIFGGRTSARPSSTRAPADGGLGRAEDASETKAATERARPKGKAKTQPKPRRRKELPELKEEELEETFVRGSGPGGQATNKTSNACSLIHLPTGLRVHCHETRSRESNRKLARRILRDKLDQLLSPPGESARDLEAKRERMKKEAKRRKAKRKADEKREAKGLGREDREDEDEEDWDAEGSDVEAAPQTDGERTI